MKVAILASISSIHTIRWVNSLCDRNYEIYLITQHVTRKHSLNQSVTVCQLPFRGLLGYFFNIFSLKYYLRLIKPDILHAHYAGGYGILGTLSNFSPYILSVWGSDVYVTPNISYFHKILIRNSLRRADYICSTSYVMGKQVLTLCPELDMNKLLITPFGVDTNKFACYPQRKLEIKDLIVIGTVKTLEPKYGIDILIRSFHQTFLQLQESSPDTAARLRLLIVGDGCLKLELQNLVKVLGIYDITEFVGFVSHNKVPDYLNKLDIYVAASRCDSESFGVAVLEASACELPVVVTNVGGLPEVVVDGKTGFIVERENIESIVTSIKKLVLNYSLRNELGKTGRKHVVENYDWEKSVSIMEDIYQRFS
jgi:glycosyltransferase involved in cell wall biosynthesis